MSEVTDKPFIPSEAPREFYVSVEVYVPTGSATRKPQGRRKKRDKESTVKSPVKSPSSEAGSSRKSKGKSSRKTLPKNPGSGTWRPAKCKISEEGGRCLLTIYLDETMLIQTIFIHLLNHTDIRPADTSLFFRKDCLEIYSSSRSRWSSPASSEPIYIQFHSTEAFNTWLALLRSYAIPEVYGRRHFPEEGGSYRMWRQVDLTIVQGRNMGSPRPFNITQSSINSEDPSSDADATDMDVSCEIYLNDSLCGRTTVKGGIGCPDWNEHFIFPDLPRFEHLDIIVWQQKKVLKSSVLGTVRITLPHFRRGVIVDGWFPILHSDPIATGVQVGELRLKIRVDEVIILPYSAYSGLLETLNSRNLLEWLIDCDHKLHLKSLSTHFMSIAAAKNNLINQVVQFADREVDGTPSTHNTIFRGNTMLTKVVELFMLWHGKPFLEASIGSVLRRLCSEQVAIEVDPVRSGKPMREIERGVELLIYWCQEFWKQIYSVRNECPNEMRQVFQHIRKLVEKRYRTAETTSEKTRNLPWQSVSAFCFLRFIVPAILHPHLFGLCPGMPPLPVQRSLTLIAKVMQSLANLNATVQKEEFMRGVKDFLQDSIEAMVDYILVVSTPESDPAINPVNAASIHERFNVNFSLRQRGSCLPLLDREAIPLLPHLIDLPKHLAMVSSAIIHSVQEHQHELSDPDSAPLQRLWTQCSEIEEYAQDRVRELAAAEGRRPRSRSSPQRAHTPTLSLPAQIGLGVPISPIHSIASAPESLSRPYPSSSSPYGHRRHRKKSTRPEGDTVSEFSRTRENLYDSSLLPTSSSSRRSSVRDFALDSPNPQMLSSPATDEAHLGPSFPFPPRTQRLLRRSTSSDSIPSYRTPTVPIFAPVTMEPTAVAEEVAKRKKGILNILSRR